MTDNSKISKRDFLKRAGMTTAGATAATTLAAPYVKAQSPIRWRLQTYAGPALSEEVIKPSIEAFNKAANGDMVIDLYTADQLVPQGELFRAVQRGTIDAAQSDDDSMASPVDVSVFAAYFPFASRYSLDVPTLWHHYGLKEIWEEAYSEIDGVTWLSTGSWDPCNFATTKPIKSLEDLKGLRVYMFPTGGRFMQRFGVVPVSLPYEDVQVAIQTGELDGVAWSGITEDYTVGWADITKYYLTNNISGAWAGSYFVNSDKWAEVPDHLKTLFQLCNRLLALPPPALVLVGRGALPGERRQARAHLDPRIRVVEGRGRGDELLGRDRQAERPGREGRGDPEDLRRHDAEGRPALPLQLRPARHDPGGGGAGRPLPAHSRHERRRHRMTGHLSISDLKKAVDTGEIDTVLVALADMQGRLIGKRCHARFFLESAQRGDAWLRLPARQRHRHGAGAGLRGGELGEGLRRLRHEARPRDAAR